jgi:hypothetical protein
MEFEEASSREFVVDIPLCEVATANCDSRSETGGSSALGYTHIEVLESRGACF